MKKSRLVKKNQIMVLYQYFLLKENNRQFTNFLKLNVSTRANTENSTCDYQQNLNWFNDFKRKKHAIFSLISSNLKSGWKIERIPAFEKSIIANAIYTMENPEILEKKQLLLLVNQTINFSKKYLEKNKCGYINKLLDLVINKDDIRKQASAQQEEGRGENLVIV